MHSHAGISGSLRNNDGNGYEMERNNLKHNNLQTFKKLRRLLQRNVKIELHIRLSVSRLFHVHHVLQNRRSSLSLASHEWLSRNERFTAAGSHGRHNFSYVNFTSFGGLRRKNCRKKRAARAARLFFFIQSIKSLICGVVVKVAAVVS